MWFISLVCGSHKWKKIIKFLMIEWCSCDGKFNFNLWISTKDLRWIKFDFFSSHDKTVKNHTVQEKCFIFIIWQTQPFIIEHNQPTVCAQKLSETEAPKLGVQLSLTSITRSTAVANASEPNHHQSPYQKKTKPLSSVVGATNKFHDPLPLQPTPSVKIDSMEI